MQGVRTPTASVALAWLSMMAVDFFLHGGLLAGLYAAGDPFLLEPREAFVRIPAGYAAYLVSAALLVATMRRFEVVGTLAGLRFGAVAGAAVWSAIGLALWSITTASATLLAAWWIAQSIELAVAGGVIGALRSGRSPGRVTVIVGGLVVAAARDHARDALPRTRTAAPPPLAS